MCGQHGADHVVFNHPALNYLPNNTDKPTSVCFCCDYPLMINKWAWQNEANEKSLGVMQLHCK
jgi:hypothetical protein